MSTNQLIARLFWGLIITALIWLGIWWGFSAPADGAVPHWSVGVAPERFARAHAFHGILASEWSWERQEYGFWRGERWCSLFGYRRHR